MMTAAKSTVETGTGQVLMLGAPVSLRPRRKRRSMLAMSFAFCVLLPLLTSGLYYTVFATDRYAAQAGFSIRGIDTRSGVDGIGALTGLPSAGSTTSDSYVVLSYLGSRQLLEDLDAKLDLRSAFSGKGVDVMARLRADASVEAFLAYWNRHIHTQFDPTSGIIAFEVQAPGASQARDIASTILSLTQDLVNDLSATARSDALRFARTEVDLQEARLRDTLEKIREFRLSEQTVDPSATAVLDIELIASLESRLIDVNARMAALRRTLHENAPSLVVLQRDADALAAQIAARRETIGTVGPGHVGSRDVTRQLALYEGLEVERDLAQQAYSSALISLEQARRDADKQQRYLAIHQRPQTAESAKYPRSLRNMLILSFALATIWGIGALLTYAVRDHLT
jgi:capsular polysaccharide transport system permease protein